MDREHLDHSLRECAKSNAVAVLQHGSERWSGAQGGVGVEDVFYLYSITKTYTAALILRAVDRGALSLDAPVDAPLPNAPFTVRQLLRHTSGAFDYCGLRSYNEALKTRRRNAWSDEEFLSEVAKEEPRFAPDSGKWNYSNTGYLLLRRLIERTEGCSFGDAIRKLGFPRTRAMETLADAAYAIPGSDSDGRVVTADYHPGWCGTGLVAAPAGEVVDFYRALFHGDLISAASRAELTRVVQVPVSHPPFVDPSYGLGLIADPAFPDGPVYGHGGGGPGFSTQALHWPSYKGGAPLTVVVLYDRDGVDAFATAMTLATSLGGRGE